MPTFFEQYQAVMPEFVLGAGATLILFIAALPFRKSASFTHGTSFALVCVTLVMVLLQPWQTIALHDFFIVDELSHYAHILILSAAAMILVIGHDEANERAHVEYPLLVLFAALGMMIMVGARDLLPLYLGLELQNLCLCILIALLRDRKASAEAALKFFALGALSSGILLYGFSLLYGIAEGTSFDAINLALTSAEVPPFIAYMAVILVLAGMAFKIGAAPFHMWVPDVYQGTPTPVLAYLASAPKIAAIAVLLRLVHDPLLAMFDDIRPFLAFLALASMIVGSLAALVQTNIKRLLAYASIAQVGFLLTGFLSQDYEGIGGVLLYMMIYLLSSIGVLALISSLSRRRRPVENIHDLAGFSRDHPGYALAMSVFLLTMAGIPPLAGFFAKFSVFVVAVSYQPWIVVIAVLMSAVSAYYYLRIIKILYFDDSERALDTPIRRDVGLLVGVIALFLGLFVFYSGSFSTMMITMGQIFTG